MPRSGKQQRYAGFSQPGNPHCWGGKPDVLQIGLSCGRKQSPGMLKKPPPGAIAPGTFHVVTPLRESPSPAAVCPSWGDIRTNRGNVPSPVVAGTLMCRIKRNYIFSQSGLGLLLNNFFFKPNSLIAGEDIILTRCQFFITNTIASLGMKVCCPIPSNSLIFAEFSPELALCPLTQLKECRFAK